MLLWKAEECEGSVLVIGDSGEEDTEEATEIPLPNVKNHVLIKVIEFCKHHKSDPMNDIEKVSTSLSNGWMGEDFPAGCRPDYLDCFLDPQPLKSANMHEVVQDWYANFVAVDQELLFELILAANYMDIKPLLDLTCATVASMIKGNAYLLAFFSHVFPLSQGSGKESPVSSFSYSSQCSVMRFM